MPTKQSVALPNFRCLPKRHALDIFALAAQIPTACFQENDRPRDLAAPFCHPVLPAEILGWVLVLVHLDVSSTRVNTQPETARLRLV
jgi:hypothetical protein